MGPPLCRTKDSYALPFLLRRRRGKIMTKRDENKPRLNERWAASPSGAGHCHRPRRGRCWGESGIKMSHDRVHRVLSCSQPFLCSMDSIQQSPSRTNYYNGGYCVLRVCAKHAEPYMCFVLLNIHNSLRR